MLMKIVKLSKRLAERSEVSIKSIKIQKCKSFQMVNEIHLFDMYTSFYSKKIPN